MKFLIAIIFLYTIDLASACPWKNSKDVGLLKEQVSASVLNLGQKEILEDLSCLRLLYKNVYAGTEYFRQEMNQNIEDFSLSFRIC